MWEYKIVLNKSLVFIPPVVQFWQQNFHPANNYLKSDSNILKSAKIYNYYYNINLANRY